MTLPFRLKREDDVDPERGEPAALDDAEHAPQPTVEVVRAPRRVRSQLVKLDGQLLEMQDAVEELFSIVRNPHGQKLLGRLWGGLETSHALLQTTVDTVERG